MDSVTSLFTFKHLTDEANNHYKLLLHVARASCLFFFNNFQGFFIMNWRHCFVYNFKEIVNKYPFNDLKSFTLKSEVDTKVDNF